MTDYTTLIIIQSLAIFAWIVFIRFNASKTPEFDSWLSRLLQQNPSLQIEDAFDEYINQFNIRVLQEANESEQLSEARAKMQLIEEYNLDDVLGEHEGYRHFKGSLEKTLG